MSHLLPTLDVGEDDELGLQEDIPSPEGDLQLPNTQSMVPNSSADDTEINQILQELTGQSVTTLTVTTSTTRLASLPRSNHMASDTVD